MDTSVTVPWLMSSHPSHGSVTAAVDGLRLRLTGHSLAEPYSILTRLPGDARVAPPDAAAAREHDVPLVTRDARARGTYALIGVHTMVVA